MIARQVRQKRITHRTKLKTTMVPGTNMNSVQPPQRARSSGTVGHNCIRRNHTASYEGVQDERAKHQPCGENACSNHQSDFGCRVKGDFGCRMKAVEPGSRANRKKTNESRHTYGCSSGDADGGFLSSDGLRLAKAENKELGRKSRPIFSALRACGSHLIFNGSDTFLANQLRLASAVSLEAAADMK